MIWYLIAIVTFLAAVLLLVLTHLRERRYLRMKASQAMDPAVWEELEEEREAAYARRDRFRAALEDAQKKP